MNETATTLEEVITQALHLSAEDKVRLIERLASVLKYDLAQHEPAPEPASERSLYGALAHLGKAPSAEEIDEARREAWANFPREDIA
jgi:hypothetical protein